MGFVVDGARWYRSYRGYIYPEWSTLESRFIDSPRDAVADADRIIATLLHDRTHDAELDADYRNAHEVVQMYDHGEASTDDVRRAMQTFRNVFMHLTHARAA